LQDLRENNSNLNTPQRHDGGYLPAEASQSLGFGAKVPFGRKTYATDDGITTRAARSIGYLNPRLDLEPFLKPPRRKLRQLKPTISELRCLT
jgi:hypothetical protein